MPYVLDGDGNCHVYVDQSADLAMAEEIIVNAKTQRPGVCNAAESLLVHVAVADEFLPRLATRHARGRRCSATSGRAGSWPTVEPATEEDFATEFLDLTVSVAVVDDLDEAMRPHRSLRHGALRGHRDP